MCVPLIRVGIALSLAPFALLGCAQSGPSTQTASVQSANTAALVAAQCRLLGLAYEKAKNPGIVEGCPGFENVRKASSNRFSEAGLFVSAASAKLPSSATASGESATIVFQKMIARGTPAAIAVELSKTAEFKAAADAMKKARG